MDHYRPNVAFILRKPKSGKILVCRRKDYPDCWQFPQGGVDDGEDLIGALYREVQEEIGLARKLYIIKACRTGYRYEFPEGHLKKGLFRGQEQTYFLCHFKGSQSDIVINQQKPPEFTATAWIHPQQFKLEWIPRFKRDVFRQVFRDFFKIELTLGDAASPQVSPEAESVTALP